MISRDYKVFFVSVDRKFNEDSKNVLKTVLFSLQVASTGNFVLDCPFKLAVWLVAVQNLTPLFSLTLSNFVQFFLCH